MILSFEGGLGSRVLGLGVRAVISTFLKRQGLGSARNRHSVQIFLDPTENITNRAHKSRRVQVSLHAAFLHLFQVFEFGALGALTPRYPLIGNHTVYKKPYKPLP